MYSIIFFGTHEFAATVLADLLVNPLFKVVLVITQPDRAVGRKKILTPPPVKVLAEKHLLPYLQPETLKNFVLPNIPQPDFGIVSQYGQLIPPEILTWPKHGLLNTHTSLLPKYRGASPVQAALMHGDTFTGLTIMQLDKGMDTGPILLQEKITIEPDDTYIQVEKKLAALAGKNLTTAIQGLIDGSITPQVQDNTLASTCGKLDRDSGRINWQDSTAHIYNLYRAFNPWPGIWTTWENKRLKLTTVRPANIKINPGEVRVQDQALYIGTQTSALEILSLQLEGKADLKTKDFLAGYARIHHSQLV